MTYADQLKSPLWQRKRLEIFNRDNYECVIVGCVSIDEQLHAHHGYYEKGKMAWESKSKFLHTLCDPCHKTTHDYMETIKELLGEMNPGFLPDVEWVLKWAKTGDIQQFRKYIIDVENGRYR